MSASRTARHKPPEKMDLDSFVPALLIFISNRLTNSGSALYRGRLGIGMMDFRVMAMLTIEPGASGTRIAAVIDLDKAAVSRTLRSLERRGLVRAARGAGSARSLTLSPAGSALYERAWQLSKERERRLLLPLSSRERVVVRDLLRRLLAATAHVAELARDTARPG
jgi:DNA-binding MarR family transcriptional regulator